MALIAGELMAILGVDDKPFNRDLKRAEQALRASGQAMGDDTHRAGQQAGQQLSSGVADGLDDVRTDAARTGQEAGDDLARGAVAKLRDARGRFRAAGQDAGDAVGDGLRDGTEDGAARGADAAAATMGDQMKGRMSMVAAGVGAAAGLVLMQSFTEALSQGEITARLGAQLGKTPAEAKKYGQIAGKLYASAITDDFQGAADAIRATAGSGLFPPGATNAQLQSIATKAADLANAFGVDVSEAAQAAGIAVKTGLAKDSTEAFDLIAKGMVGLDKDGEDLLETISEYGVQFAKSGLSGRTAVGLMRQAIQAGWKDTDKLADAFKELELRVTGGEKAQVDALKSIGLNADEMIAALSAGGQRGEEAMTQIHDAIVELGPESNVAKKAIQELFGGPGEDLGAALFKLNLHDARNAMGDTAGAADKLGNTLRDNAGTKVKQFQRGLQQGVVDFLGGTVIPGMERFRTYLGSRFSSMWAQAGQAADGDAFADRLVAFFGILAQRLATKVGEIAPKIVEGLTGAGQRVAEWVMANPTQVLKIAAIAAAIIIAVGALPALVALALSAAAVTMMTGFVLRLLSAAGEKLPQLGESISTWFGGLWSKYVSGPVSRAWASFIASVKALPGKASAALSALGPMVTAKAASAWNSFRDATVRRAMALVGWVRGLPGLISRGVGHLGSLLYGKGQDVVRGLLRGIQGMGGWLRSRLISFARNMIPGPIAKALGIASPSKVMAKQVGRWIPRGIVAGIESTQGEVDRTMAGLVTTPTPSASYAGAVGSAVGASSGAGRTGRTQAVTIHAGDEWGDLVIATIRKKVRQYSGANDVPVFLGGNRR
ncbi:phage tail tape measure protein [Streptomyces sp. NPDC057148]|uniref:phage tail tape measure protein n=1 Tax=unclassified Streptomyces TaxID=2593676 RepID=UPI0036296F06